MKAAISFFVLGVLGALLAVYFISGQVPGEKKSEARYFLKGRIIPADPLYRAHGAKKSLLHVVLLPFREKNGGIESPASDAFRTPGQPDPDFARIFDKNIELGPDHEFKIPLDEEILDQLTHEGQLHLRIEASVIPDIADDLKQKLLGHEINIEKLRMSGRKLLKIPVNSLNGHREIDIGSVLLDTDRTEVPLAHAGQCPQMLSGDLLVTKPFLDKVPAGTRMVLFAAPLVPQFPNSLPADEAKWLALFYPLYSEWRVPAQGGSTIPFQMFGRISKPAHLQFIAAACPDGKTLPQCVAEAFPAPVSLYLDNGVRAYRLIPKNFVVPFCTDTRISLIAYPFSSAVAAPKPDDQSLPQLPSEIQELLKARSYTIGAP